VNKAKTAGLIARLAAFGTIFVFFIFNVLTPLLSDDFSFFFDWKLDKRLSSFKDIFLWLYEDYLVWGGRSVGLFFCLLFPYIGNKMVFNVFNTLLYALFIVLINFHVTGTIKRIGARFFLAINLVLWFFVPVWGQNFLWQGGSCLYLVVTSIILLFLVPFRKKFDEPAYKLNIPLSILFFFLGVLAGWSVENSGAAVLFLLIAYFIFKVIKKEKLNLFEMLGAIGFLTGFIFLLAAPGNYIRISSYELSKSPFYIRLIKRFFDMTKVFVWYSGPMLVISGLIAFDLIFRQKKKVHIFIWFYTLAGLASVYSMILSPYFNERAYLITVVFFTIVGLNLLSQIKLEAPPIIERNRFALTVFFTAVFMIYSFLPASKNMAGVYLKWKSRTEYILGQKAQGNLDITIKAPIPVHDKHVALYGIADVDINKSDGWLNRSIAQYFGVRSIDGVENDDPW
jgi:hypothetical protein